MFKLCFVLLLHCAIQIFAAPLTQEEKTDFFETYVQAFKEFSINSDVDPCKNFGQYVCKNSSVSPTYLKKVFELNEKHFQDESKLLDIEKKAKRLYEQCKALPQQSFDLLKESQLMKDMGYLYHVSEKWNKEAFDPVKVISVLHSFGIQPGFIQLDSGLSLIVSPGKVTQLDTNKLAEKLIKFGFYTKDAHEIAENRIKVENRLEGVLKKFPEENENSIVILNDLDSDEHDSVSDFVEKFSSTQKHINILMSSVKNHLLVNRILDLINQENAEVLSDYLLTKLIEFLEQGEYTCEIQYETTFMRLNSIIDVLDALKVMKSTSTENEVIILNKVKSMLTNALNEIEANLYVNSNYYDNLYNAVTYFNLKSKEKLSQIKQQNDFQKYLYYPVGYVETALHSTTYAVQLILDLIQNSDNLMKSISCIQTKSDTNNLFKLNFDESNTNSAIVSTAIRSSKGGFVYGVINGFKANFNYYKEFMKNNPTVKQQQQEILSQYQWNHEKFFFMFQASALCGYTIDNTLINVVAANTPEFVEVFQCPANSPLNPRNGCNNS